MKAWSVTWEPLEDEGPGIFKATTRAKAKAKAFVHIGDVFENVKFGELRVIRAPEFDGVEFRDGTSPDYIRVAETIRDQTTTTAVSTRGATEW
jgi:hypothetical protein